MQLMCDAVSVLGSRHGVLWNPAQKECQLIRFSPLSEMPKLQLRAGIIVSGEEYVFPLCQDGENFFFHDQRITPCTMTLMGIDPGTTTKTQLSVVTPFRPRDAAFSTTPVLALRLCVEKLPGLFRWLPKTSDPQDAEIFLELYGDDVQVTASGDDALDLQFSQLCEVAGATGDPATPKEDFRQYDRLVALNGTRQSTRLTKKVTLTEGAVSESLDIAWCNYNGPVLQVHGTRYPFHYAERFADLDAVVAWAREHLEDIFTNAAHVDGIVGQNNSGKNVNSLLAQTLHSWLACTWWVQRDGSDWFSVWEGNCNFHSTVDVEYTQTPFYLAVWPELLRSELDFWPEFSKDGTKTLGEPGAGTLFLSHDVGAFTYANGQQYPHEMEVEETANYLILAYCYYKRTGDETMLRKHQGIMKKYLAFLAACDSTGDLIPDMGVANTIDDASPAIQYGREQVYLAVKTLAAYAVGAEILKLLGNPTLAARYHDLAARLRPVIEERGWMGDHFATLLEKSGELTDPWTGKTFFCAEIPGWDAAHIYTENGIALLDMVGFDLGLDREKLVTDLRVATDRCLREYGCVHSAYNNTQIMHDESMKGLAGAALSPGWISMNMLRDIAAFYRGIDFRVLAERYWEWQVVTNTQEARLFFETFKGNMLSFYPRGIAIWGYFDALAGLVIDVPAGAMTTSTPFAQIKVPRLYDADWAQGTCTVITS
ncbi:MAG TPA: DUF4965 domain-containing protein [Armatimonadota bacterium]